MILGVWHSYENEALIRIFDKPAQKIQEKILKIKFGH